MGGPTLVRRSHFNTETSASLNSGFNVLEALRFLLQLFFLFIHDFFFLYTALKMSLTFPPSSPLLPLCAAAPWQRGGLEAAGSEVCVFTRCGGGDLGAVLSLCLPSPSAFPAVFLFV